MPKKILVLRSADGAFERPISEEERALLIEDWQTGLTALLDVVSRHEETLDVQGELRQLLESGGEIVVDPGGAKIRLAPNRDESADSQRFSIGIFHCTFDANFRNWKCGWGPG